MASFGVGVYVLTIIWFITLMLCWVSLRTGHYIGKISVAISVLITILLLCMPTEDVQSHGANFYDKLFVLRFAVFTVLIVSVVLGLVYCFVHVCLTPVETRKIRNFGTVN